MAEGFELVEEGLPLISPPTRNTVIGKFEGDDASDIFQIVGTNGAILVHMNEDGVIDPPVFPQTVFVQISSTQLLAAHTTPITLVTAPVGVSRPAKLYVSPQYFSIVYTAGATPYSGTTVAGNFTLGWGTTTADIKSTTISLFADLGFVDQPVSKLIVTGADNINGPATLSNVINQPLSMFLDTDTLTGGDGTLLLTLQYSVVEVP